MLVRLKSVPECHHALPLFFASIFTVSCASLPVFSSNKQLEKLVVHPQTGVVYVGAMNRLYQLSFDSLVKQGEYQTGPKHTNGQCLPPEWKATSSGQDLSCLSSYKLVDFHNQLFLLNHTGSKGDDTLIVCGNAYAGECNFHSAENVSSITISSKDIFDEANNPRRSILASQYKTLSTAAVTSTFQNGLAALFVASVTPPSPITTPPAMNVVNLNASDLLAQIGQQSLSRWNERGVTHRPRQAFKSGQFVYFTSYQYPTKDNVKYKTVLSRICTNDLGLGDDSPTILAYMEASIKCGSGSMPFDYLTSQTVVKPGTTLQTALQVNAMEDILIASFAQNYNPDPKIDSVSGLSTICIFKMSEIEQQFKNTQEDCRKGKPGTMKGLSRDGTIGEQCQDITKVWNGMSCSPTNKVNFVLEVRTPIVSQPAYNLTSGQITTVAATVVGESTVVFVGTNNGSIIKLQLDSRTSVVQLSNSPVVELMSSKEIVSMSFSHDSGSLFVMSKSEVVKVPTHTCSMLSSCNECVASNDPYCGFCMLENKCSSQLDCQQSTDPHRWLQSNSSQCIAFIPVNSLKAPIATPKQISLQVLNVPMIGSFECVFGDQGSTVATRSGTSQSLFSCQTPQLNRLQGSGESLDVSVSLKSTLTGIAFVPDITTLTLFNCRVHTTCSLCTASTLPCGWCLYNGLCTDTSYDCRIADYWKEDVALCPKLKGNEYFWPSGVGSFNFSVYGENFPQPQQQDQYECIVAVLGYKTFTAPASRLSASLLECSPSSNEVFSYSTEKEVQSATLNVKWTASGKIGYQLEKEDGFSLTLFKCEVSANDCSQCLAVDHRRKCGWCTDAVNDEFTCTVVQECHADWIEVNSASCPKPVITGFKPPKGPRDGGTNVTIEGSNLGVKVADISLVTVEGIVCKVVTEKYAPSKTIVCTTSRSSSEQSGKIRVTINKKTVESDEDFAFVDVTVSRYQPTKGPAAGGTKITVYGDHLDSGSEVGVTLAGIDCAIKQRTNKYLVCTTKSYYLPSRSRRSLNSSVPGDLQVFIDKARPTNSGNFEQFTYTPNPIVSNIKPLRGLAAGGIPITVRGDWLTSIQKPLIVLFNENYTSSFPCQTATDRKVMTCVQPSYPYPVAAGKSVEVNVTFVMDDVPRMSLQLREPFSFWSNPVFEPLSSFGKRVFDIDDEDHIKIEGSNLNVVDLQYYIIRLGDSKWCNVTKLEIRLLWCTPDKGNDGETLPMIVTIGNFSQELGLIEYSTGSESGSLSVGGIIGIAIAVTFCLLAVSVFLTLLFANKYFSNKNKNDKGLAAATTQSQKSYPDPDPHYEVIDEVLMSVRRPGPNEEGDDSEYEDYFDPPAGSENTMRDNPAYGIRSDASS